MEANAAVAIDLTLDEAQFLERALQQWGGPGRCTEALAAALGFNDLADFSTSLQALIQALKNGEALSRTNWTRVLLASEIAFASDVVGAGVEWPTVTGWSDEQTIRLLRELQRKLMMARVISLEGL